LIRGAGEEREGRKERGREGGREGRRLEIRTKRRRVGGREGGKEGGREGKDVPMIQQMGERSLSLRRLVMASSSLC